MDTWRIADIIGGLGRPAVTPTVGRLASLIEPLRVALLVGLLVLSAKWTEWRAWIPEKPLPVAEPIATTSRSMVQKGKIGTLNTDRPKASDILPDRPPRPQQRHQFDHYWPPAPTTPTMVPSVTAVSHPPRSNRTSILNRRKRTTTKSRVIAVSPITPLVVPVVQAQTPTLQLHDHRQSTGCGAK